MRLTFLGLYIDRPNKIDVAEFAEPKGITISSIWSGIFLT